MLFHRLKLHFHCKMEKQFGYNLECNSLFCLKERKKKKKKKESLKRRHYITHSMKFITFFNINDLSAGKNHV